MKTVSVIAILFLLGFIPVSAYGYISLAVNGNPADEYTTTVGSVIQIGGISTDSSYYACYIELLNPRTTAEWASWPSPQDPVILNIYPPPGGPPELQDIFMIETSTNPPPPGLQWTVDLRCIAQGDAIINLLDSGEQVIDTLTIHQVPEPMMVTLLALGGLMIRRRRKK